MTTTQTPAEYLAHLQKLYKWSKVAYFIHCFVVLLWSLGFAIMVKLIWPKAILLGSGFVASVFSMWTVKSLVYTAKEMGRVEERMQAISNVSQEVG